MPPRFKSRFSVSCSDINPYSANPEKRWYVWKEQWTGWRKVGFLTFMRRTLEPKLRERLMKEASRKGMPATMLEQAKEPKDDG